MDRSLHADSLSRQCANGSHHGFNLLGCTFNRSADAGERAPGGIHRHYTFRHLAAGILHRRRCLLHLCVNGSNLICNPVRGSL
ncbi:hypothetical protein D3C74_399070 [compost metagenome]